MGVTMLPVDSSFATVTINGSLVLFTIPIFNRGTVVSPVFPVPLPSDDNESLVLEVTGSDGVVFLNAQGSGK